MEGLQASSCSKLDGKSKATSSGIESAQRVSVTEKRSRFFESLRPTLAVSVHRASKMYYTGATGDVLAPPANHPDAAAQQEDQPEQPSVRPSRGANGSGSRSNGAAGRDVEIFVPLPEEQFEGPSSNWEVAVSPSLNRSRCWVELVVVPRLEGQLALVKLALSGTCVQQELPGPAELYAGLQQQRAAQVHPG